MSYSEPTHPKTGQPLTDLDRTLLRMRWVAHEAHMMLRGSGNADDLERSLPHALLFSLCNQALILVSKFLEVWNDFGSLAKDDRRIIDVRRAIGPLIDRIKIWPRLEQFRNTTLAHPYLTSDGRLIGPRDLLAEEKAPNYPAEDFLLLHLVQYAVGATLASFSREYHQLQPILMPSLPHPSPGAGISLWTEIEPTLKPLVAEVHQRLGALGLNLRESLPDEGAFDPLGLI